MLVRRQATSLIGQQPKAPAAAALLEAEVDITRPRRAMLLQFLVGVRSAAPD